MSGEFAFIDRLRRRLPPAPAGQTWVGDDAAVLADGLLLATDALVDGVHFNRSWCSAGDVGWKALAVNCSDIAAMGGTPVAAVTAVVLPPAEVGLADALLDGMAAAGAAFACPLVGGDTTAGPTLVVTVAVVGSSPAGGAVLRSGAAPGETVFVTGPLGGAKVALAKQRAGTTPPPTLVARMCRPEPRLAAGWAAAAAGATAMIDISDGFAADLGHVLTDSGVGVRVDAAAVPCDEGVSLDDALFGGDDYELCFTAANPDRVRATFAAANLARPVAVGVCTADAQRVIVFGDREDVLPARGWEHDIA